MLLEWLVAVHYEFFMTNKRFWNDKHMRDVDQKFVVLASNIRSRKG